MYYWSFSKDQDLGEGFEETIKNCINEARHIVKSEKLDNKFIFIAKFENWKPCIDVDGIITSMQERAYNEFSENAYGWLENINLEHIRELEDDFNDIFKNWLDKHNYKPTFGTIQNIEKWGL